MVVQYPPENLSMASYRPCASMLRPRAAEPAEAGDDAGDAVDPLEFWRNAPGNDQGDCPLRPSTETLCATADGMGAAVTTTVVTTLWPTACEASGMAVEPCAVVTSVAPGASVVADLAMGRLVDMPRDRGGSPVTPSVLPCWPWPTEPLACAAFDATAAATAVATAEMGWEALWRFALCWCALTAVVALEAPPVPWPAVRGAAKNRATVARARAAGDPLGAAMGRGVLCAARGTGRPRVGPWPG